MVSLVWVLITVVFPIIAYFVYSRRRSAKKLEPWQKYGWLKGGDGIPAPTGSYEVGCVDLMHKLEGDSDGLLVRLFYPTDPGLAGQYQYATTTPDHHYIKGFLDFLQYKWSGLITTLIRPFSGKQL